MLLALHILLGLLCLPMMLLGFATTLSGAGKFPFYQRFLRPVLVFSPLWAVLAMVGSFALAVGGWRAAAIIIACVPLLLWIVCVVWLQLKMRFFVARRHVHKGR